MSDTLAAGDSKELEDLFDSVAAQAGGAPLAPPSVSGAKPSLIQQLRESNGETDDSAELQDLFDSVSAGREQAQGDRAAGAGEASESWEGQDRVFRRVGQMARQLHNTLHELGYHELLQNTINAIPDTRDRLAYVATVTEQAACRVLNATDVANPLQEQLEQQSAALAEKWDAVFANRLGIAEFKQLAEETRSFLKQGLPEKTGATKAQLLEIMMAQDFQDLTGQVIKKIITIARELESQLMGVLIETIPGERRTESVLGLLNGPVIDAAGRSDVVATQQQVDDLLDSLGF